MPGIIVEELKPGLRLLRVNDTKTRFFEALWEIPEGITYNAYLLDTGEGYILFDGWKSTYAGDLLRLLERLIKPEELKYIIVHHMEPDHTGSLPLISSWAPQATILGHPMASRMLKPARIKGRFKPVKDGEELKIGDYTLRFIYAPWIHWPETIFTYIPELNALLTCDAFGSYGVTPATRISECKNLGKYLYWTKKYLVTVVGNYRKFIVKAVEKLNKMGLTPTLILPGHGLIWDEEPGRIIDYYLRVSQAEAIPGKITIIYASMYGNTEQVVHRLAASLAASGYKVKLHGLTDTYRSNISDILADVIDTEVLVIAAPTYEASLFPLMKNLLDLICEKASAEKKLFVIASYAWGGIAGRRIRGMLESCGYKFIGLDEKQRLNLVAGAVLEDVEAIAMAIREEAPPIR